MESLPTDENTIQRNISESDLKETSNKNFKPKIRLFSKYSNINLGITSDNYSDLSYIKAEEIKNYLKSSSNHGLTGLKNIGNSSYMNSIIQCLSNTPELMFYYISELYKKNLRISEGKKKE